MRIDVYLDNAGKPFRTLKAPDKFRFDSTQLPDGAHALRFVAVDDDGITSERRLSLTVQNGPTIAVHGLVDDDVVAGEIDVLVNAYGSRIGDAFEPARIETPAPIPIWAWLLILCAFAWGSGYAVLELDRQNALPLTAESMDGEGADESSHDSDNRWVELGERVYGNTCSSCHQPGGLGLAGVFPSLVHNEVVEDPDPTAHIEAIMFGVAGKVIDGVAYSTAMPQFGDVLSDEEIAAVVNHERTQWGNDANLVETEDVEALRNQ